MPGRLRPTMMAITPVDGAFHWSVSFTNDPRLPRMGSAVSFDKALAAVRAAIRTASQVGTLVTVDRRPPAQP